MTAPRGQFNRRPVYVAIVLAAAAWVYVAVTAQALPRLLLAIGIAALPLLAGDARFRAATVVALILMCLFIFVTMLGAGIFLIPSAIALLVAAILARR